MTLRTEIRNPAGAIRGFSLIELMVVVVIIGIIVAVTVPSLAGSIRGQKLRLAASSVVKAGKHARSMAVMRQHDVYFTADPVNAEVRVDGLGEDNIIRRLDGVTLEPVEINGEACSGREVCSAVYYRNGRCSPYSVRISDVHGKYVLVKVDAMGSTVTESGYR